MLAVIVTPMKMTLYSLLLCASLAGCGTTAAESPTDFNPDQRPLATTMVYDCNGFEFTARLGPGEMALWLPDRYVILSQVRAASGTKYQEADLEFWSKDDEALLTVGELQYRDCRLRPERVPWEDARRRGVDFRAIGNEPGWYLEIKSDHLLFVGGYGTQRVLTPGPVAQANDKGVSYHAITEANDLMVEVVDAVCADTMSGELFPSQVTVTLNGRVLYGCGRALDYPWE